MGFRKFSERLVFIPLVLSIMILVTFLISGFSHRERLKNSLGSFQSGSSVIFSRKPSLQHSPSPGPIEATTRPTFIDSDEVIHHVDSPYFTPFVASTLEVLSKFSVSSFIIEPCVLWSLLTAKEQELLKSRRSAAPHALSCSKVTNEQLSLFSIGVYAWEISEVTHMAVPELKRISEDLLEVKESATGQISHIFLREGKEIVHIVVFFGRNAFFFVFEVPLPPMNLKHEDLRYGSSDMAFEQISLSYHSIEGMKVLLPTDYLKLLFELPHSRFLECHKDRAKMYYKKYPQTPDSLARLHSTIDVMRQLIFTLKIPIWMDGGSLIGWARHCSCIPYERDADFASWSSILQNDYTLAEQIINGVTSPWYFIETFGMPWMGFELRLYNIQLDWQVDFFFTTQDEQNSTLSYLGYHNDPGVSFVKLYYENKIFETVCSGEVLGYKILVPCRYDLLLTGEYGKEWIVPDERHFLKYQPGQHRTYWTEEEGLHAYQCLGRNQFSIRKYNYTKFSYTPKREVAPGHVNENFREAIDLYKSTCTRLRWNRSN